MRKTPVVRLQPGPGNLSMFALHMPQETHCYGNLATFALHMPQETHRYGNLATIALHMPQLIAMETLEAHSGTKMEAHTGTKMEARACAI